MKNVKDDYFKARVEKEVDLSGSGRAAFQIDEENTLKESFQKSLSTFENGNPPKFTAQEFKIADAQLNEIYSKIMKTKDFSFGTVDQKGIKTVQKKWLKYREAWVEFGKLRYPNVSSDSWRTWLTKERSKLLQHYIVNE